jgi:hypothetical protein
MLNNLIDKNRMLRGIVDWELFLYEEWKEETPQEKSPDICLTNLK